MSLLVKKSMEQFINDGPLYLSFYSVANIISRSGQNRLKNCKKIKVFADDSSE